MSDREVGLAWQVGVWDRIAQIYWSDIDRRFAPVVDAVLARADLQAGERILDMGTGAAVLGRELMAKGPPAHGHVLISHTHWDHIQGIPFFAPFHERGSVWDIYAPRGFGHLVQIMKKLHTSAGDLA